MTARFARVVIGVGDGDVAPVVALARTLAAPGAAFMLVRIDTASGLHGVLPGADADEATAAAMRLLHAARVVVDTPCELVVHRAGSVARGLHEIAEREAADLIVVDASDEAPSHGGHPILHHAPCSVAVAPRTRSGRPAGLSRVGLAYLPTHAGRRGLAVARAVADRYGVELHATTVVPVDTSPWLGPAVGTMQTLARLEGTLEQIAQQDLVALTGVVGHVVEGDPVRGLVRFSEHVDLLVVGTRSIGPLHRLVAGSTTDALCDAARCPMLVVAGGPGDDPGR